MNQNKLKKTYFSQCDKIADKILNMAFSCMKLPHFHFMFQGKHNLWWHIIKKNNITSNEYDYISIISIRVSKLNRRFKYIWMSLILGNRIMRKLIYINLYKLISIFFNCYISKILLQHKITLDSAL